MDDLPGIIQVNDDVNMSSAVEMSRGGVDDNNYIPYKGMVFDNEQDAYEFYSNHGERVGFSVRIQAARKNKDGHYGNRIYVCSREGFRRPDKRQHLIKTPRAETRTGCGATMKIKFEKSVGKYVVYTFTPEHNHEVTRPDLANMLSSQQRITAESAKYYLRTKRQRALPPGEAASILRYLQCPEARVQSISYALQLDCEEKITNIFWADAQMRDDYEDFGDAVSCDTTYKLHKDSRPFVVLFGYNHHRDVAIFGAAFMYDETPDSFTWLFETFLRTMSNKHPKTIFTDQDEAIAKALAKVMPNTFHRLCKWHIMQSALKYVPNIVGGPSNIHNVLGRLLDEPEEENEWLTAWHAMLDEFGARENTCLQLMFARRQKWAPPYVRWHWLGGMRSTQLSENTDADLLGFLRQDSSFSEFVTHFESSLDDKRVKECEADYDLSVELPEEKVPVRFLQHAGQIYTEKIFVEVREEFIMSLETDLMEHGDEGGRQYFIISPPPGCNKSHRVTRDDKDKLSCSCRLFDMQGIMCGHMIKVLREVMNVHEVPGIYILKRWTKEARNENVNAMLGHSGKGDQKTTYNLRYKVLISRSRKISWRASQSEDTYEMAIKEAIELLHKVEGMRGNVQVSDPNHSEVGSISDVGLTEVQSEGTTNSEAKGVDKHAPTDPHGIQRWR